MSTFVNQKEKVNKNEEVTKLNQEILNIFKKINEKNPQLHNLLHELSKNYKDEKKKTKYIEDLNNYINSTPTNSTVSVNSTNPKITSFNNFFYNHITIGIPENKQLGGALQRIGSTTTLSQEEINNVRKNHFKIIYKEEGQEDIIIPFEFQTIISFEGINEHIKKKY